MRKELIFFVFIFSFFLSIDASAESPKSEFKESMLVTTEWLAENLNDPAIIVLYIGNKDEFNKMHIPGSRLFPIMDIFKQPTEDLNHEIPSLEELNDVVRSIGIKDDSRIILYYSEDWLIVATRVYLTFDYIGLAEQTSILDGGFAKWLEEDRIISSDLTKPSKSQIAVKINEQVMVDVNWINKNLRNPEVVLIDSRPEEFYDGSEKEDFIKKFGHITGAVSIPFLEITIEDPPYKFKDKKDLEKLFLESGVKPGSTVVVYCNTGIWASLDYFTAKYLGYDTRFYDGSFEEWTKDDTLPVTEPVKISN